MAFDPDRWTSTTPLEVLIAPATTTTRTPTRSRPRRWPANTDVAARRRDHGHDNTRTPAAPRTGTAIASPTIRRRAQVANRRKVTPLDRARVALVAALLAAGTAALASVPHRTEATSGGPTPPSPAAVPTATTAPCSPVEVGCCPATPGPVDMVRELRPACP